MERAIALKGGTSGLGSQPFLKTREKVRVGPGLGECEAGYETSNCGEVRVLDGEGYMHRREGAEDGRVKVEAANRILPIQDGKSERKWGFGQD